MRSGVLLPKSINDLEKVGYNLAKVKPFGKTPYDLAKVIPFGKTPYNLAKAAVYRSPLVLDIKMIRIERINDETKKAVPAVFFVICFLMPETVLPQAQLVLE